MEAKKQAARVGDGKRSRCAMDIHHVELTRANKVQYVASCTIGSYTQSTKSARLPSFWLAN